ncbi:hypothetical protein A3C23_01535 [Candidatus Roizmanbacteria bacterium RIFCSPHIGHO2_02_FULL_37_13b]|uniref:EamA domain-containing protein n=1 Tax=Candidatus Roizmanbacteria bacterium RIFCSPLOWO2_02_FULL_36_11 TaxID=1802071 RepID=A0A1F7JIH9_9BACT|nr:MAG: hypothetical protein A3C23_01535 [Candidatus Roizmanbacteria bacterium RIFCSPHIGHO2_02_FULL_37_13b]OGK55420.1 MAG: hypothetical protein A3H78_06005 [Candidatus Roizmanbacteria bacterium RIFCSPLOWO2_02_FULL_36_11]
MPTYALLISVMVLWGLYPIVTHYFVRSLDPLFLVLISTFASSLPFIAIQFLQKNQRKLISKKTIQALLPVALFASLGHVLLFVGTKYTSGVNTGLLLQIEPIYAMILGVIFFKELFGLGRIGSTLTMIMGAMIIVYKGGATFNIGDILILLAPLMYQLSHTLAKKLMNKDIDTTLILAGRMLYGGIIILVFIFIYDKSLLNLLFSIESVASGVFLGFYLSVVVFLWYSALKKIPISVASAFLPLTALISLVGSSLFLRESITPQHYIGLLLIVGGMIWISKLPATKV